MDRSYRQRNQLPQLIKERRYIPSGARLETLEKQSINDNSNSVDDTDDLLSEAKECAVDTLLTQLSASELLTRRLVCKKWKTRIDKMMAENVKHIILFEDRFNVREYEAFLNRTGIGHDQMYSIADDTQSSLVLLVNEIERIAESTEPFGPTTNVKKLTFYGGSKLNPNWHGVMHKIVSNLIRNSKLTTLVVHRYGYYKGKNDLELFADTFTCLEEIHLVQPSVSENIKFSATRPPRGYTFAGGHVPVDNNQYCRKVKPISEIKRNMTKVYVHHIAHYLPEHTNSPLANIIDEESYE